MRASSRGCFKWSIRRSIGFMPRRRGPDRDEKERWDGTDLGLEVELHLDGRLMHYVLSP